MASRRARKSEEIRKYLQLLEKNSQRLREERGQLFTRYGEPIIAHPEKAIK